MTDAAGGDNAANVEIGPSNNPLHSVFSNVDIELGGKLLSDPNGLYPYRAYIETLLSYSKEARCSRIAVANRNLVEGHSREIGNQGFGWSRWNEYRTEGPHAFLLEEC